MTPWTYVTDPAEFAFEYVVDANGSIVAQPKGADRARKGRLIAAAPEMATLLRKIAGRKWNSMTQGCNAISEAQREVRALLSRIEGEGE
ncbi:hypothetical protein [Caenibius sp. WL]|uniref:hypothetical protein n=1 Tax=Caenibius sp. WL TaxID=2872646 RepID=UPI001C990A15|nr:hypothetical protein [Caenibius sp. WL]QZP07801.1 hypothetical protein K5X80_14280 [Caenibius sp. WL]QZP09967.1 hypothetical protein K5X80_16925 [Caenibius sp. WL]